MADDLIERLDEFATRLLDDVEREPKKGAPAVTIKERIDTFRAITAYLDKRSARAAPAGKDGKPAEDTENEPTILRLQRQVNRRRRA